MSDLAPETLRDWTRWPDWGPEPDLATPEHLEAWILENDEDFLVLNKPPWLVCHPSKNGPWSSLVGACREYTGLGTVHLVSRLDRETSGVVLLAKHRAAGRLAQKAIEERKVRKSYTAILHGELRHTESIDLPLGPDKKSAVAIKQTEGSGRGFQEAVTHFHPVNANTGFSLVQVELETGRKHQIRAHAQIIGFPVAGDKLYGPDEELYLAFTREGWTARHADQLVMRRQALHAHTLRFSTDNWERTFEAPLWGDMAAFAQKSGLVT